MNTWLTDKLTTLSVIHIIMSITMMNVDDIFFPKSIESNEDMATYHDLPSPLLWLQDPFTPHEFNGVPSYSYNHNKLLMFAIIYLIFDYFLLDLIVKLLIKCKCLKEREKEFALN